MAQGSVQKPILRMRIIAGKARGMPIKAAKGVSIRPTSDLVRGAIFSILESLPAGWSSVLDLYAGTGSMGIEALSRGAEWVDFVEQNPRCCSAIKENLAQCGLAAQAHVCCCSVTKALASLHKRYDIVIMGPPYRERSVIDALAQLATSTLVGPGSIVVVEHSYRLPLSPAYGDLHLAKERRHGDTCISIYQQEGD